MGYLELLILVKAMREPSRGISEKLSTHVFSYYIICIIAHSGLLWAEHVRTMKRSLCILVFALVATSNLLAQTTETPVSFAYLPGRESTLKYKFSYGKEQFFTQLRFIKGSSNAFLAGDRIIMEPNKGETISFSITEDKLKDDTTDYIPFETSVEEIDNLQKGVKEISLVRNGKTLVLEQNRYFNTCTKTNAHIITHNACKIDKLNAKLQFNEEKRKTLNEIAETKHKIFSEQAEAERKIIEEKRKIIKEEQKFQEEAKHSGINNIGLSWREKYNGWKNSTSINRSEWNNAQDNTSVYPSWRNKTTIIENLESQTSKSNYKSWRD